jgi:hypothetical protein
MKLKRSGTGESRLDSFGSEEGLRQVLVNAEMNVRDP